MRSDKPLSNLDSLFPAESLALELDLHTFPSHFVGAKRLSVMCASITSEYIEKEKDMLSRPRGLSGKLDMLF